MNNKDEKRYLPDSFQKVICHNTKLKPYLNAFNFKGENFDQQNLGEIFGVIQILDHSENSAYVPNLIAQVIKKEFYSKHKRNISESFEASLHKANLALADLAQHEVIEWIGKINAIIGVVKNEEFHFTQAGGGKILLIRNKTLTDVSKGLDTGEGIGHPIKTFLNVSSGELELKDKLLFASDSAFESIHLEELKRHIQTFKSEELDNIISSTLELEATNAAILFVNITDKPLVEKENNYQGKVKLEKDANYFGSRLKNEKEQSEINEEMKKESASAKISADKGKKKERKAIKKEEPLSKAQALAAAEAKIKKEKEDRERETKTEENNTQNRIDERAIAEYYNSDDKASPFEEEPEMFIKEKDIQKEKEEIAQKINESKIGIIELGGNLMKKNWGKLKKLSISFWEKIIEAKNNFKKRKDQTVKITSSLSDFENYNNESDKIYIPEKNEGIILLNLGKKPIHYSKVVFSFLIRNTKFISKKIYRKIRKVDFKNIFNPTKIKETLKSLPLKIKSLNPRNLDGDGIKVLGLIGFIIIIIIILFLAIKFTKPFFNDNISGEKIEQKPSLLEDPALENESKIDDLKSIAQVQVNEEVISITSLNNDLYLATENDSLLKLDHENNRIEKISLPDYVKEIQVISAMPSLQLVFLINSESIYSYSPVTKRFYENQIDLPGNFNGQGSDVYLTYIYLLDKNSNQIFQYPRAIGGFGEKRTWLKDNTNITGASEITIDDSIYLAYEDGHVEKFFQGRKQNDFNITQTEPTISASKIRASLNSENLFIFDSQNQRVVEVNKKGTVIKQFQDRQFLGAQDFWVDFDQEIIYIITSGGNILSFNYN